MSKPVFEDIFGEDWYLMPPVMRKHYANRAYCNDVTVAKGTLKIESTAIGRLFYPFLRMMKVLIPRDGDNIATTVRFVTTVKDNSFEFDREMIFPGSEIYSFRSRMLPCGGNELIEYMSWGIGWRVAYAWDGAKVILGHKGYVLKIRSFDVPLPLEIILGHGYAEEIPLTDDSFAMMTEIRHRVWGKIYGYSGTFFMKEPA